MVDTTIHSAQCLADTELRKIGFWSPFRWLRKGWTDLRHSLWASLTHGLIITAMGWIVLMFTSSHLYMFTAAISGFLLISPVMTAGLYELSRSRELGRPPTFDVSLASLKKNGSSLMRFAMILVPLIFVWLGLSGLVFKDFFGGDLPAMSGAIYQTSWHAGGMGFILTYGAVGGVIAVMAFVVSVISVPMIMDRGVAPATAMLTSAKVVWLNLPAMLHWAVLLAVLTVVGFATQLWAMIVIIPWLGHATWHAYRDTVG